MRNSHEASKSKRYDGSEARDYHEARSCLDLSAMRDQEEWKMMRVAGEVVWVLCVLGMLAMFVLAVVASLRA